MMKKLETKLEGIKLKNVLINLLIIGAAVVALTSGYKLK